jgi:uncharacterized protein
MSRPSQGITASPRAVRRLAVTKQHLSGKVGRPPNSRSLLRLVRDLGCVQLDPLNVVAPSHLLVLWSRLGPFDPADLETLLWKDRSLFEYWGHQASIVVTEDYPLYYGMMRRLPGSTPRDWTERSVKKDDRWLRVHSELREYVLRELKERGPLLSRQFRHPTASKRRGAGWSSSGDLPSVLQLLFLRGEVMVAGRFGRQRMWDLPERCLPTWVARIERTVEEVQYEAVQRALRSLGVASAVEIRYHFLRNRYPHLSKTIERLVGESKLLRVESAAGSGSPERYIHTKDLPLLETVESDDWQARTTLLSPFDNLICDRARTERVFDFRFRFEAYVPPADRQFGPYVLSILHGDRLIGRIDPLLDRKKKRLLIKSVHAEKNAPKEREVARGIGEAVDGLASFLGVTTVEYTAHVPSDWRGELSGRG